MLPERALEQWAWVCQSVDCDGLGYSSTTSIGRMMRGELTSDGTSFGSRIPRGVTQPGLRGFLAVERTLKRLRPYYRAVLKTHYVEPVVVVGRTNAERAAHLGITPTCYADRLQRFKQYLREDASSRPA